MKNIAYRLLLLICLIVGLTACKEKPRSTEQGGKRREPTTQFGKSVATAEGVKDALAHRDEFMDTQLSVASEDE